MRLQFFFSSEEYRDQPSRQLPSSLNFTPSRYRRIAEGLPPSTADAPALIHRPVTQQFAGGHRFRQSFQVIIDADNTEYRTHLTIPNITAEYHTSETVRNNVTNISHNITVYLIYQK